ncbi:MAG: MerR family transcriptional regulator [Pseudomonadota bacterium]
MAQKADDAFKTISEVADLLGIQKHVLRFWESKFSQVRPMKRGGGRRFYRPEDMALLRGIRHLLHTEAYTIKGVQKILREQGVDFVKASWQPKDAQTAPPARAKAPSSKARANNRGGRRTAATARAGAAAPRHKAASTGTTTGEGTAPPAALPPDADGLNKAAAMALRSSALAGSQRALLTRAIAELDLARAHLKGEPTRARGQRTRKRSA